MATDQTCEFWTADAPCDCAAVECLVYCNPLIDGGHTWTCAGHLTEHMTEHLLVEASDGD